MSRIGKLPVQIPSGVTVELSDKNILTVKGKLGELKQWIDPCISVTIEGNTILFTRHSENKLHRSKHGLYRTLVNNMVIGVSTGFSKKLLVEGVGYKVSNKANFLELSLGFSHNIVFEVPKEVTLTTLTEKGQLPSITLSSYDKELLGQVAAKIRKLRGPEPYKGKGIRYDNEIIRRKAGKTASSK